jgi:hypothetical protein
VAHQHCVVVQCLPKLGRYQVDVGNGWQHGTNNVVISLKMGCDWTPNLVGVVDAV